MLKLVSVMIGSGRPKALIEFYTKVLGKPSWGEKDWAGWQAESASFMIGPHSEVKGKAKEPPRIILNFESRQPKKEAARVKELGSTVIKELYQEEGAWIATFADPDGNYFQVTSPWKM